MSVMELPTPLIGNKAHQPRKFQFPQCEFGKISSFLVKPVLRIVHSSAALMV